MWSRVLLSLGWLGIAIYVVSGATRTDERVKNLIEQKADELTDLSSLALERILPALMGTPESYFPENYEATIYLYDNEQLALLPFFPEGIDDPSDVRSFRAGRGATGTAWERKDFILVTGDAVSDGSYGLTPDQQRHFTGYGAVVAYPILEPTGKHAIGVLAAIGRDDDQFFESDETKERFQELADVIGLVITKL